MYFLLLFPNVDKKNEFQKTIGINNVCQLLRKDTNVYNLSSTLAKTSDKTMSNEHTLFYIILSVNLNSFFYSIYYKGISNISEKGFVTINELSSNTTQSRIFRNTCPSSPWVQIHQEFFMWWSYPATCS